MCSYPNPNMSQNTIEKPVRERRFVVRGVNDDESHCMCCGKEGLKRVVWIEDMQTGKLSHYGTTCAVAKEKGFMADEEIKREVRKFDKEQQELARKAYYAECDVIGDKCRATKDELYAQRGGLYKQVTSALNGRVFTIPADSVLMDRCHEEAFSGYKAACKEAAKRHGVK